MPIGPDLTDEENERLRVVLRALVKREGSQNKLAPKLGIRQASLSQFLSRKKGGSFDLARRAATAAGLHPMAVLDPRRGMIDTPRLLRQVADLSRVTADLLDLGVHASPALQETIVRMSDAVDALIHSMAPEGAGAMVERIFNLVVAEGVPSEELNWEAVRRAKASHARAMGSRAARASSSEEPQAQKPAAPSSETAGPKKRGKRKD